MSHLSKLIALVLLTLGWLLHHTVAAQTTAASTASPGTIRFVVPYPAGGPLDQSARFLAEQLRTTLSANVIVENKPGAGGNIGADQVAKAAPDGGTILMGAVATHAINPSLFKRMPYDAQKDFAPVSLVAEVPNVLIMSTQRAQQLNIKNTSDLIQYAQRNPGKLNYASGGNGSAGHLAGELFKQKAKVFAVHIPFSGAGPAQLSLLAGETDFMFDNLAAASTQLKAGRVIALALTSTTEVAALPGVKPLAKSGLTGFSDFDITTWFGVFAPANTPAPIVQRYSQAINQALQSPLAAERFAMMGAQPNPSTPQQLAQRVARDLSKYANIVRISGAKVD